MSELYNRIEKLCSKNGENITSMCKSSGASRASMTDLKMGRKQNLSAETLSKIANYFGVTVDYLLTGEQKETAPAEAEADNDEMAELLETVRRRPDLQILFSLSKKATPDDVRKTIQIIKTICGDDDGDNIC